METTMSNNQPTTSDLLEAVMEFLENKVMPKVPAHTAFHTKVAVNALRIVKREMELGPDRQNKEYQRLQNLLGAEGNLNDLNTELCRRISSNELNETNPDLIDHLWKTTMDRLSVDNPEYSAYKKALRK
jgi:hypothetical protein